MSSMSDCSHVILNISHIDNFVLKSISYPQTDILLLYKAYFVIILLL